MAVYVPRVLLCGDAADFRKIIGNKPAEVVGQVTFEFADDKAKIFFDERLLTDETLNQLLDGAAEYLIFTDPQEHRDCLETFPLNTQIISATAFAKKIRGGFFSYAMAAALLRLLAQETGRALDFDCFLAAGDFRTSFGLNVELACVEENFGGALFPIMENLYGKIYRTFDECRYQNFDAVILAAERTPAEFVDALIQTDSLSEKILAFVRRGSALEEWLAAFQDLFVQVSTFSVNNGAWCLIEKRVPPADVGIYVVTHKDADLPTLPDGYRIIHAGHALAAQDFGYLGDDTGDNISRLNPFLDEITALYWVWKNSKHTHAGLVHYRRLFTTHDADTFDAEKILRAEEILQLLSEYDIIVNAEHWSNRTQLELMILSTGQPGFVGVAEKIVRKHLAAAQPDYLDAYDAVINGYVLFICGVFVTRRNIFDAYCEWLFSFILGATEEMRDNVTVGGKRLDEMEHIYSRITGNFAERMLTVWLAKNHLRIKTLPLMFRD